jgi:hypothetical protein
LERQKNAVIQKNSPAPEQTEQGADQVQPRVHDRLAGNGWPSFAISNLRPVTFGKVRALFDLCIGPVTLLECRLVVDDAGAPQFVSPNRIKEDFTKVYRATTELDRKFAALVFEAVVEQLAPAPAQTRPARARAVKGSTPEGRAWAVDQEARFERRPEELKSS